MVSNIGRGLQTATDYIGRGVQAAQQVAQWGREFQVFPSGPGGPAAPAPGAPAAPSEPAVGAAPMMPAGPPGPDAPPADPGADSGAAPAVAPDAPAAPAAPDAAAPPQPYAPQPYAPPQQPYAPAPPGMPAPPQFAAPWAPPPQYGQPQPYTPAPAAPGFDQLAQLFQALTQRRIPPLPPPAYAPPAHPAYRHPHAGWPQQPQQSGIAMLNSILGNPQFQQALQWSAALGPSGPRAVQLPLPAPGSPGGARSTSIPMGAVMNAIASLAGQSMTQFNAGTREDEAEVPEYLVDEEGEFVVDPASAEERAALVAHLFRMNEHAHRAGWFRPPSEAEPEVVAEDVSEVDETELWAREAGFTR